MSFHSVLLSGIRMTDRSEIRTLVVSGNKRLIYLSAASSKYNVCSFDSVLLGQLLLPIHLFCPLIESIVVIE